MTAYRIIVTGSRDWTDALAIENALMDVTAVVDTRPIVLVQGGAPGADAIAKRLAERWGWQVETFEADWAREGKAAGPKRNRRMRDAGADVACAFPVGGRSTSPGTWDCIEALAERGIHVRVHARAALEETRARR